MMPDTDHGTGEKPFAVVLGATSLVGRHLVKRLADSGFKGLCLSRQIEPTTYETPSCFSWQTVPEGKNLSIPASATLFSLAPVTALPTLIKRIDGGNRLIVLSSSSVFFKAQSSNPDERDRAQAQGRAEEKVKALCEDRGIAWTIFRPAMIYDPGRDRNVSRIATFIQRFRFFPVVWPGTGHCQPIHADDVAQAMVAASGTPRAQNRLFDLPGGEILTYREMILRVFEAQGKRPVLIYLPLSLARVAFYLWQKLTGEKYSSASLERMNMALTLDPVPVRETLGLTSQPFRPEFPDPE